MNDTRQATIPDPRLVGTTRRRIAFRPPALFLFAVLAEAGLGAAFPFAQLRATAVQLGGAAALAGGIAICWLGERRFRREGVAVCPGVRSERLVTEGLFRFTRNPMYLGLVVALVGIAAIVGSPWALAPAAAFGWIVDRLVRREEALLRAVFATTYAAYCARVPRWIGAPGRPSSPGSRP